MEVCVATMSEWTKNWKKTGSIFIEFAMKRIEDRFEMDPGNWF